MNPPYSRRLNSPPSPRSKEKDADLIVDEASSCSSDSAAQFQHSAAKAVIYSEHRKSLFLNVLNVLMKSDIAGFDLHSLTEVPPETPPQTAESAGKTVKERAIQRKKQMVEHLQAKVNKTKERNTVAQNRRTFLTLMKKSQSSCMWYSLVTALTFATRCGKILKARKGVNTMTLRIVPILRLRMLRNRRKQKVQDNLETVQRPTLATLKTEKILNTFEDEHLTTLIPQMQLSYFYPGETVILMGAIGIDAFVLASGEVDVLIHQDGTIKSVDKLTPTNRPVIGVLGMISGQPRAATLKATTEVFAWKFTREIFEGSCQGTRLAMNAFAHIAELRERNFPKLYPETQSSALLKKYASFEGVGDEILDDVVSNTMYRKALRPGDVLLQGSEVPPGAYFLLRGTVIIYEHSETLNSGVRKRTAAEKIGLSCETAKNHNSESVEAIVQGIQNECKGEPNEIGRISAPALLGFVSSFFGEPSLVTATAANYVDLIMITRMDLLTCLMLQPSSVMTIQQNINNNRCWWVPPLSKQILHLTILPSELRKPEFAQPRVVKRMPVITPEIIEKGDTLYFRPGSRDVYIFVDGQADGHTFSPTAPQMWPWLPVVYFACYSQRMKASDRLEAWKMKRVDLVEWLHSVDVDLVYKTLDEMYSHRFKSVPHFVPLDESRASSASSASSAGAPLQSPAMKTTTAVEPKAQNDEVSSRQTTLVHPFPPSRISKLPMNQLAKQKLEQLKVPEIHPLESKPFSIPSPRKERTFDTSVIASELSSVLKTESTSMSVRPPRAYASSVSSASLSTLAKSPHVKHQEEIISRLDSLQNQTATSPVFSASKLQEQLLKRKLTSKKR